MGNNNNHKEVNGETIKLKDKNPSCQQASLKKYTKLVVIGKGGFGKVLIILKRSGRCRTRKIKSYMP